MSMRPEQIPSLLQQLTKETEAFKKDELLQQLTDCMNYLLQHDFAALIQILYRVDVNEQKLKQLLQQQPQTDAALLIAHLLLERQEEKRKIRQSFRSKDDIPEDEKW